jgi:hypothetical protein
MSKKVPPTRKATAPSAAEKKAKKTPAFAIDRRNYKYIAIGFGVMILGFLCMLGGGSKDPNLFDGDKLFSFTRITLSTILVVAGFVIEVYAIMKRPKAPKLPNEQEQ